MARAVEHRCGQRFAVLEPAEMTWGSFRAAVVICDISSSGAFICTQLRVPRWGSVRVTIDPGSVAGWVVRVTAHGIGIEWWDFAPREALSLTRTQMDFGPGRRLVAGLAPNQPPDRRPLPGNQLHAGAK